METTNAKLSRINSAAHMLDSLYGQYIQHWIIDLIKQICWFKHYWHIWAFSGSCMRRLGMFNNIAAKCLFACRRRGRRFCCCRFLCSHQAHFNPIKFPTNLENIVFYSFKLIQRKALYSVFPRLNERVNANGKENSDKKLYKCVCLNFQLSKERSREDKK